MPTTQTVFSPPVQEWLDEQGKDLDTMTLDELKEFRNVVTEQIDKDVLLDLSVKLLGNGAYGASSHPSFYFYNIGLASDITAECRETTKYMEVELENFFHNEWWTRTDLHDRFDIVVDQTKRDWYSHQTFTVYGDTDSLYCCYGDLFKTFSKGPSTDKEKLDWILKFNKEFLDKWNNSKLDERFNGRHGKNIHEFELETVSKLGIFLMKKKYTQALVFSKGNYYLDKPKIKGKGVELIKAQTPSLARTILTDLVDTIFKYLTEMDSNRFAILFAGRLKEHRQKWMVASEDDISFSGNIGKYSEAVYCDTYKLDVKTSAGLPTKGIARYNFMCNQRNLGNMCIYSGKIKYYYISEDEACSDVFSYQSGELPEWAPGIARIHQFQKCVVDPINRFLSAAKLPLMNKYCAPQLSLFV